MFAVGQTVRLNKDPLYGECPDYLKEGDKGTIIRIEGDVAAVEFECVSMGVLLDDLEMIQ